MNDMKSHDCRSICPIANILDVVGDRWTLLVIRDLLFFEKHEYHEFLNAGEGVSTNILAERLKRLLNEGIVKAQPHATNKKRKLYYLTSKGKDLLPIMTQMAFWGGKYLEGSKEARPKIAQVQKNPALFSKKVLATLSKWEKKHLEP
ncbi:MAG: helix-turn-helix domain-containing protein [Candidatus Omnitrophota bacterium]|nr:helix-turn-helix domain-containing protein [Candidatus Omnitrophota bacterium]